MELIIDIYQENITSASYDGEDDVPQKVKIKSNILQDEFLEIKKGWNKNKILKGTERFSIIYKKKQANNHKKVVKEEIIDYTIYNILSSLYKFNVSPYIDIKYDYDLVNSYGEIHPNKIQFISVKTNSLISVLTMNIIKLLKPFALNISDEVLLYCINRYLNCSGLHELSKYHIVKSTFDDKIMPSLVKIHLINSITTNELFIGLTNIILMNVDIDAIKAVLEKEYYYLRPEVAKCKHCSIESIDIKNMELVQHGLPLIIPDYNYGKKIKSDFYENYSNPSNLIGVCLKTDQGYLLIDGYFRLVNMIKNKINKSKIIILNN